MVTLNPKLCNTAKRLYKPPLKFLLFWAKFKESDSNFQLSMYDRLEFLFIRIGVKYLVIKNFLAQICSLNIKVIKGRTWLGTICYDWLKSSAKQWPGVQQPPASNRKLRQNRAQLTLQKAPRPYRNSEDRLWHLNGSQLVPRSLKCSKKISSHTITPSEALIQDRKYTCFHVV